MKRNMVLKGLTFLVLCILMNVKNRAVVCQALARK